MKQKLSVDSPGESALEPGRSRARVTLPISGLACGGGGVISIEQTLQALTGVIRTYVNPATEMAYVEYWPTEVTTDQLATAIEELGYETIRPHSAPTEEELT